MNIEIIGKFFDNHSLTIINRNIALYLKDHVNLFITPLDEYDPKYNLDKDIVRSLKKLQEKNHEDIDINVQLRHSYPPVWQWPTSKKTKVVYIQPWEYPKLPFEWQYKWETFADGVIVPSNYIKDIAIRGGINPEKVSVIPNGFDENTFNHNAKPLNKFGIDPNKFNFLYIGNPQWRKGLDILINQWHKCFKSYDNARLIIKDSPEIYGKNNVLNEIVKMQFKTGCAKVIYIDETLSNDDMAGLYASSKAIVHPYRAEGFGMHIQEAVACGCIPVLPDKGPHDDFIPNDVGVRIQTNLQGIDITSSQVFAQKPGDSFTLMNSHTFINEPDGQSLQKALQYIYHSHDKESMISKTKNVKMENTWKNVSEQYLKVIEKVNGRKSTVR